MQPVTSCNAVFPYYYNFFSLVANRMAFIVCWCLTFCDQHKWQFYAAHSVTVLVVCWRNTTTLLEWKQRVATIAYNGWWQFASVFMGQQRTYWALMNSCFIMFFCIPWNSFQIQSSIRITGIGAKKCHENSHCKSFTCRSQQFVFG